MRSSASAPRLTVPVPPADRSEGRQVELMFADDERRPQGFTHRDQPRPDRKNVSILSSKSFVPLKTAGITGKEFKNVTP